MIIERVSFVFGNQLIYKYGSSEDTYKFSSGTYDKKWDDFKDEDPDDEDIWTDYCFNSKSFINILKVK